uniref:Frenatin 2.2S n=1 Tax=Sphaenorhynchus lacteus TaxID=279984 RepID=FRE22_SPHLA|nr:RecName: Full=Frenatin 2.2S; Short=F2.2S [Sphaenorhynchus lacteus]
GLVGTLLGHIGKAILS